MQEVLHDGAVSARGKRRHRLADARVPTVMRERRARDHQPNAVSLAKEMAALSHPHPDNRRAVRGEWLRGGEAVAEAATLSTLRNVKRAACLVHIAETDDPIAIGTACRDRKLRRYRSGNERVFGQRS